MRKEHNPYSDYVSTTQRGTIFIDRTPKARVVGKVATVIGNTALFGLLSVSAFAVAVIVLQIVG